MSFSEVLVLIVSRAFENAPGARLVAKQPSGNLSSVAYPVLRPEDTVETGAQELGLFITLGASL